MLTSKEPNISVIMPAYNCGNYVAEAIESVLNQTYTNFEFIIIDDASTDDTYQIICSYTDPRVRVYRNDNNCGIVYCLNTYIPKTRGKYIARMDADDISLPTRFQQQIHFMEKHPRIGVLGTWVSDLDSEGLGLMGAYPIFHEAHRLFLLDYPSIVHPTTMFRKSILDKLDIIYDPNWLYAEEYELLIRLATFTKLHNIPKQLLKVRIWKNSTSSKNRQIQIEKVFQIRRIQFELLLDRQLSITEQKFINVDFNPRYFNLIKIRFFFNQIIKANAKKLEFNLPLLQKFQDEKMVICLRQKKRFQFSFFISLLTVPVLFPRILPQLFKIAINKWFSIY